MASDLAALIADQDFQGLPPADKRTALSRATGDQSISGLSDPDTMQFVSRAMDKIKLTRPDLVAPPGVPTPQVPGNLAPSALDQAGVKMSFSAKGDLPFFYANDPNNASAEQNAGQFNTVTQRDMGQVAGATAGTMAGMVGGPTAVTGGIGVAKAALKAAPYVAASEGINLLRQKLGTAGKFIPSGAEMIPYFMMGGGKGSAASASAAEAGAAEGRIPVGKFTKEVPNPDPYKFKGAPDSMNLVQSTNVGKVGYEPDSRTMTVEYRNGMVYSYHGVPQEIYNSAKDSESIGSYISRNVKGRYETVRRGSVLTRK